MNNIEILKDLLESLGLENKEAIIYLEALKLGTSPASIIAKKVGLSRTSVRYTCEILVKKGLMIESKKMNTKYFMAESPEKIRNLILIEKNKLEMKEQRLNDNFSKLLNLYNPYTKIPKMTYYDGKDGIKKVLNDHLKSKDIIYSYLDLDNLYKNFSNIQKWYSKKRIESGVRKKRIYYSSENNIEEFLKNYPKYKYKYKYDEINQIKIISNTDIKLYIAAFIYNGKFSYISMNENGLFGVIIEDIEIYDFHKNIFNFMWNNI